MWQSKGGKDRGQGACLGTVALVEGWSVCLEWVTGHRRVLEKLPLLQKSSLCLPSLSPWVLQSLGQCDVLEEDGVAGREVL